LVLIPVLLEQESGFGKESGEGILGEAYVKCLHISGGFLKDGRWCSEIPMAIV
jgi:hypothetical protein